MTDPALIDLRRLGDVLKSAAEALAALGDSIAHIISLGDNAWATLSARRARTKLNNTLKAAIEQAIGQILSYNKFSRIANNIIEKDGSTHNIHLRTHKQWQDAMSTIQPLLVSVSDLLQDIKTDRSDFVLEKAYASLQETLCRRIELFKELQSMAVPSSTEEIEALKRALNEWKRLISQLQRTHRLLRNYLKENDPDPLVTGKIPH